MENAISNVNLLSEDSDETHNMHAKSDNIEIMMGSETILFMNFLDLVSKNIKKD